MRLAILDDYQDVALSLADWGRLGDDVEIERFTDTIRDEGRLIERLKHFDILCLMRERTPITESLLAHLPNLKHIYTSGMRNKSIDLEACRRGGVVVTGSPTLDYPTAELTMGLVLALARQIPRENQSMHAGGWATSLGIGLRGSTLGILGLGRMGRQVAQLAGAFGMNVIAWSENLTKARCEEAGVVLAKSKQDLLRQSDFVSIHLMLGERTRGLLGTEDFGMMKPSAYLINTARAQIVDEAALIHALEAGQIAGVGLDVYETEPLPQDHPLRRIENAILMPHHGYVVEQNYRNFYEAAVNNILAWRNGEIINEVTRVTGPQTHVAVNS